MAFGIKTKNIKTQNSYTIESFFDAIKDKEFTAGTPSLTKHGMATVITFPALDSQNQVWIMKSGFGKETQKFSIQKSTQAGMDCSQKCGIGFNHRRAFQRWRNDQRKHKKV